MKSKLVEDMRNSIYTSNFEGISLWQVQTADAACETCYDGPEWSTVKLTHTEDLS